MVVGYAHQLRFMGYNEQPTILIGITELVYRFHPRCLKMLQDKRWNLRNLRCPHWSLFDEKIRHSIDWSSLTLLNLFFGVNCLFPDTINYLHRSGYLPGAYVFSCKKARVFNRPPRSRGRVLDVNFWFSRILGFLGESGPFAPLVFSIR